MNCSVENCQEKTYARNWCRKHYRHVVEGGHNQPLAVPPSNCKCGKKLPNKSVSIKNSFLCRKCYYAKWLSENEIEQKLWKKDYCSRNKEKQDKVMKLWRKNNKIKINTYYAEKRKDPLYRVAHNLRSRLYDFLKGRIRHKSTKDLTGCSFLKLKTHLECQFTPNMNWDNYGNYWVIDHIIPLISIDINDKIGLERLAHYSNLRPLTTIENASKAAQDKLCKKNF